MSTFCGIFFSDEVDDGKKKARLLYRRQFLPIIRYFSAMSTGSQNLSDRPKGVSEWNCDGGKKNHGAEKKKIPQVAKRSE